MFTMFVSKTPSCKFLTNLLQLGVVFFSYTGAAEVDPGHVTVADAVVPDRHADAEAAQGHHAVAVAAQGHMNTAAKGRVIHGLHLLITRKQGSCYV